MDLGVQEYYEEPQHTFQDQDAFNDSGMTWKQFFIVLMRDDAFPIIVTIAQASAAALLWSHLLNKNYWSTFIVYFGCFYCSNNILTAAIVLFKASVPAYAISESFDMDFPSLMIITLCGWKINPMLGITLFAMYGGYDVLVLKKKGDMLGYGSGTNDDDEGNHEEMRNGVHLAERENRNIPIEENSRVSRDDFDALNAGTDTDSPLDENLIDDDWEEVTMETNVKHSTEEKTNEDVLHESIEPPDSTTIIKPIEKDVEDAAEEKDNEDILHANLETSDSTVVIKAKAAHPGLGHFHRWFGDIGDIYRQYQIATVNEELLIPIIPRSERGRVPLRLLIQNETQMEIEMFWMDYRGNEEYKGPLDSNGGTINITTWIGHPWVFREKGSGKLLLHYVPFRVFAVIEAYGSIDRDDIGTRQFSIVEASNNEELCGVKDEVFPYPSTKIEEVTEAVKFAIQQMKRERVSPRILLKYLHNIALHPFESKYRQIRVANRVFRDNVWSNGARGVLYALGFEANGRYIEMGPNRGCMLGTRVRDLSETIILLEEYLKEVEDTQKSPIRQPRGADGQGSGRAGWRM